jgi:hypothetical protein
MNIIKLNDGKSVVIDTTSVVTREGYYLNTNNNEVIYYNGNCGELDTGTGNIKKITHSWPVLNGTKALKTPETLRYELEYWIGYEPVNGMGKFARQTRIDSLSEQIDNI